MSSNQIGMEGVIQIVRSHTSLQDISLKYNYPELLGVYKVGSQTGRIRIVETSLTMHGSSADRGLVERILKAMMPRKDHLIVP